jgi:hypothetical protein
MRQEIAISKPNEGILGFYGNADSVRILSVGVKVRRVKEVRA